jgi:indoleamine 2,3-dioxygenase
MGSGQFDGSNKNDYFQRLTSERSLGEPGDRFSHHRMSAEPIDTARGFLPTRDPLERLPRAFDTWEEIAADLPKLLGAGRARDRIGGMPLLDAHKLRGDRQWRRAMLLLSYMGHAYVWMDSTVADRLPEALAIPWHAVARKLGRPPVLSYASYALDNWRRLDPQGPIELGNIALLQNFLAGVDEEWFILVHVDIEAKAGPALTAIGRAQAAVHGNDADELSVQLGVIGNTTRRMYEVLERMPERCDPYIYYRRVRPYIHGWKNHPLLPKGVVYAGVEAYQGEPQRFRGETGAQSGIVPALDAVLGIDHADDPMRPYLMEMRDYMPPEHRRFVERIERGPSVRSYVLQRRQSHRDRYNDCVHWLAAFRAKHFEYADTYIFRQAEHATTNPTTVGTGGTPFMPYLAKHRDETLEHRIE